MLLFLQGGIQILTCNINIFKIKRETGTYVQVKQIYVTFYFIHKMNSLDTVLCIMFYLLQNEQ